MQVLCRGLGLCVLHISCQLCKKAPDAMLGFHKLQQSPKFVRTGDVLYAIPLIRRTVTIPDVEFPAAVAAAWTVSGSCQW